MSEGKGSTTAEDVVRQYAGENDTDVVLYNGPIDDAGFGKLVKVCCDQQHRAKKILLILLTYGGEADAAYRSARFLQEHYEHVTVFIPSLCKSAGTILAIGAHSILMSEFGELGPLDVQILKPDDLERSSGATVVSALKMLKEESFELFEEFMLKIKRRSSGAVTLRTCMDIAASVTVGIFKEISSQIDPAYLGEMNRNLKIAYEYGRRLADIGQNIEIESIRQLVYDYPEHGFIIDRNEASELFDSVEEPGEIVLYIWSLLGQRAIVPNLFDHDIALLSALPTTQSDNEETAHDSIASTHDTDATRTETADSETDSTGSDRQIEETTQKDGSIVLDYPSGKCPG